MRYLELLKRFTKRSIKTKHSGYLMTMLELIAMSQLFSGLSKIISTIGSSPFILHIWVLVIVGRSML